MKWVSWMEARRVSKKKGATSFGGSSSCFEKKLMGKGVDRKNIK